MDSSVSTPSAAELNLLLEWPAERTRSQWVAIFGASIALHLALFLGGLTIPSLVGQRAPEKRVITRRIPLYLPPDLLTQRAPNRQKVTKQFDVPDVLASRATAPVASTPKRKRAEAARPAPQQVAKNVPRILPQPPAITNAQVAASNSAPGLPAGLLAPSQPGAANGIPAPVAPKPSPGPFQDIGGDAQPNPNPKLAPPRATVAATIRDLQQTATPRAPSFSVNDDVSAEPRPRIPGAIGQAPAQHAAVELQSDPNGADFKAYLTQILTIVRANWRRVVPESARMGALRGRTVVEFIIDRDGSIPKLVTASPSGSEALDRAAVAGLSMSNPLPPLPADFKGFQVRLAFTFAYNLPSQ